MRNIHIQGPINIPEENDIVVVVMKEIKSSREPHFMEWQMPEHGVTIQSSISDDQVRKNKGMSY